MALTPVSISDDYFSQLSKLLAAAKKPKDLYKAIVNAPFHDPHQTTGLGLGIVVLLLVNAQSGTIDRIAVTDNEMTRGTFKMTAKPFGDIKIPINYRQNFIARAIAENHYMITTDWQFLFIPELTPEEARFNQAGGGISCSVVYPLSHISPKGAMIFSYYESIERIGQPHHNFMARYIAIAQKALRAIDS